MTTHRFPRLFSETTLGPVTVKNRIVSTGHHTHLAHEHPNEHLIAYHEARARNGAGLIITEVVAVHETAMFSNDLLMALSPECVAPFRKLAQACQRHGAKVFAQLFHPGREILSTQTGLLPVAYAPSSVPNERFHIMPKELPEALIHEIIAGYGQAAAYLVEAGYDGVEVVASHGYLPAQFLNPRTNLRTDAFGGDAERRLAFVKGVAVAVRKAAPSSALGLRISGDELDENGLTQPEVAEVCAALAGEFDYFSMVAGSSASLGGSVHIVPPMGVDPGYTAPCARKIRVRTNKPVIVTGRINQPQVAERILEAGDADLCGMTRALIADPELPGKLLAGCSEEVRACIACNQSCIGRAHKGFGISCIQHPVSGRELEFSELAPAAVPKRVVVIGGGPAGMKAAVTASGRGHRVTLFERERQLGGQVLLAQELPGRAEFGGMATNLVAELERSGVEICTGTSVTAEQVCDFGAEAVVLATGARPWVPPFEGHELPHVFTAWEVLRGEARIGDSVAIADWRADWIGLGLAERLASAGAKITLCTNAALAGETLQLYTRNHYVARLHKLGVRIRTHLRLFGTDNDTAYFQDTLTQEAVVQEGIDTLVLALGHQAVDEFSNAFAESSIELLAVGDCVAPRTAEEAIYEGFTVGLRI